jgi:hypothetical protein
MKSDISEIKRTVALSRISDPTKTRTWSSGQRTSRTDAPMVGVLSVDTVDAVFEEESLSFVESVSQMREAVSSQSDSAQTASLHSGPTGMMESLTSQLEVLESQCVNLRRMLEMAAIGAQ